MSGTRPRRSQGAAQPLTRVSARMGRALMRFKADLTDQFRNADNGSFVILTKP
jgi:hypothetical protein